MIPVVIRQREPDQNRWSIRPREPGVGMSDPEWMETIEAIIQCMVSNGMWHYGWTDYIASEFRFYFTTLPETFDEYVVFLQLKFG